MQELDLKEQARSIFTHALRAVDAGAAVRQAVKLSNDSRLTVNNEVYKLTGDLSLYAVALGKAAYPMALALDEILDGKLVSGVVSGVLPEEQSNENKLRESRKLSAKWLVFAGGHPLPNEASLAAAESCFNLLREADTKKAIIFFLISGGGSAMMESPLDKSVTLADLREASRALTSCGASIAEVNVVRGAFSRVKNGGLAALAPRAVQISLIVSDTEPGDEASVASGPTINPAPVAFDELNGIISRYTLETRLPRSILKILNHKATEKIKPFGGNLHLHHVLLDNQTALLAAADCAKARGLVAKIEPDISQQKVESGCAELISRMNKMSSKVSEDKIACLISGGEFSCPVRGAGKGGRNSETALRMASMLGENTNSNHADVAFLSAGTDGVDGNSAAAGAVCDQTTLTRAHDLGLNTQSYLENSDSYTFFQALGDLVVTHPTGTNVRDLRIMIARKQV